MSCASRSLPGYRDPFGGAALCLGRALPVRRWSGKVGRTLESRGIKAIYASTSPITAVHEAYHNFSDYGFSNSSIRPRVFCGAAIHLQQQLDLTDAGIRKRLGFTLAELLDEDWLAIQDEGDESWTQATGRGAQAAGFEGLVVPSARNRPRGTNVVIFPENLLGISTIRILGEEDLPNHPSR